MNGIDPFLVALIVVLVVFALRDALREWWLISRLLGPSAPVPFPGPIVHPEPVPAPGPVAPGPSPVGPVVVSRPRNVGITATDFAGGNDSIDSRTSAYDGKLIDGDRELAAALPSTVAAGRLVRAFYKGRTVDVPVRDKGPWNTTDPYWETGSRPQAETYYLSKQPLPHGPNAGRVPTNPSGIDFSPATWKALGWVGNPQQAEDKLDWDFADILDGKAAPAMLPSPGTVPAHLVLMRKLRDMGVHAEHDSAIILSWPVAIANKFPEMADYCKLYQHDSTPWCGLTVAYVMAMSGIRPQFGPTDTDRFLWADAWRQFGTAVETPQPGDVLVFKWAGGGHHVTLYDHEVNDNFYHCTGGNQGDGHILSTEAMSMVNCTAIRRPS